MKIKDLFNIKTIYILATIHCIILFVHCGRQWYSDTLSYIAAWDVISNFQIDMWRTPVYPLFLGIIQFIFGPEHYLLYGTIIQHIVFLISIYYFHQLATDLIKSQTIALSATAFYALYPCIATWNCYMITEPFAIYGTIFMLYCGYRAYQKDSYTYILGYAFWTLFLVFLRPAQVYILPVFFVGWLLLLYKKNNLKKVVYGGLATVLTTSILLLCYSFCYQNKFGIISPSGIGVINKYYISRMEGILKPEYTNNEGLKHYLQKTINEHGQKYSNGTDHDLYMETEEAIYTYGLKEVSDLVKNTEMNNIDLLLKGTIQRFHKAANDKVFETYLHKWRNVTDIFGINIKVIYWILIFYPFFILGWIIMNRQTPWFTIILYMLGTSHLFLIIFACQNVWDRLILPATPIYIILIGLLFKNITLRKISSIELP